MKRKLVVILLAFLVACAAIGLIACTEQIVPEKTPIDVLTEQYNQYLQEHKDENISLLDWLKKEIEGKGPKGDDGLTPQFDKRDDWFVWKYENEDDWHKLIRFSDLKGVNGAAGKTPILRAAKEYIQWKYENEDDSSWRNLIRIADLKGQDGDTPVISINEDGFWVINGEVTGTSAQGQAGRGIDHISLSEDGKFLVITYTDETEDRIELPAVTPPVTTAPTAVPTVTPTAIPSVDPTVRPTITPTSGPTVLPTGTPTITPTATPTATPTVVPTTREEGKFFVRVEKGSIVMVDGVSITPTDSMWIPQNTMITINFTAFDIEKEDFKGWYMYKNDETTGKLIGEGAKRIEYPVTTYDMTFRADFVHVHDFEPNRSKWITSKLPSCVEEGERKTYCKTCKEEIKESIPMVDHKYVLQKQGELATCTAPGYGEYYQCSVCKKFFTEDDKGKKVEYTGKDIGMDMWIDHPLGHDLSSLFTYKAATCTEDGYVAHYVCLRCGEYIDTDKTTVLTEKEVIIKATGSHSLEHRSAMQPTCISAGVKEHYQCTVCKKYFTDNLGKNETTYANLKNGDATGIHSIEWVEEKPATCSEDGVEAHYECTVCHAYFEDESGISEDDPESYVISAGHKFSSTWSYDENYHWHAATCGHNVVSDKAEHTFKDGYCTVCGCEDLSDYKLMVPTVDIWEDGEVEWSASSFDKEYVKGYAYRINGGEERKTKSTSTRINKGDTIEVKVLADTESGYFDSDWSAPQTY